MTLLGKESLRYREVADVVQVDAALTAGLLRVANTAMIGSRFPVSSVMQALALLGIERVAALVTTLSLGSFLHPVSKMPVLTQFWRHNLATALASTLYATKLKRDTDEAYIQGLLHDIGRLGMLMAFRDEYAAMYMRGRDVTFTEEREHFGFDHMQAGSWLSVLWNLPPGIANPVATPDSPYLAEFACHSATAAGYGVIPLREPLPELPAGSEESTMREFLTERVSLYEKAYSL